MSAHMLIKTGVNRSMRHNLVSNMRINSHRLSAQKFYKRIDMSEWIYVFNINPIDHIYEIGSRRKLEYKTKHEN